MPSPFKIAMAGSNGSRVTVRKLPARLPMTIRTALKATVTQLGLKPALERVYLESGLLGERLQYLVRDRPEPSEAIVVAGSARSGSTWLADLLCSVPGIQQIFEPLRELPRWLPVGAPAYPKTC